MKQSLSSVRQPQRFDFYLILILTLICITSLIAIYSSSPLLPSYLNGTTQVVKQFAFYLLGAAVVFVIMYVGNEDIYKFAVVGYKIFLGMLIYLFIDSMIYKIFGRANLLPFTNMVNGANSWFDFPILGTLQPSEFMKIILIIITAHIIKEHNENKIEESFESDLELVFKIAKWALPPLILILIQPDTGIFIIIFFSIALMVACSGIRKEWIYAVFILAFIAIIAFFAMYHFAPSLFDAIFSGGGYKSSRIYGWLDPEGNLNGSGLQLYTALISIGSAGLTGHGFGNTVISSIPEAHTDFIFAVVGLNYGFIGCMLVVGLCLALDIRLFKIATRSKNQIEKMMITGFIGMLLFQQVENIGMVIGLLPITGITLPLISYGGSSLLSYMICFGIILNASAKAKKLSDFVYD